MPEAAPVGLPFKEAADYLRQKINLPSRAWTDLREGQHTRAFVVAGATKEALLADFRQALQLALDAGETLADFRKRFDDIVKRHGWSYKGSRGWRSAVIYDTNLRMSHAAGRWQQINRLVEAQRRRGRTLYLRYVAVLDSRTRPEHRKWHGVILPADHPWWETHYPPNGWKCRCTVEVLTERDLKRWGYEPSAEAPPVEMERRQVRVADGGTVTWPTPKGIDTGFGYNVGRAAWGQRLDEQTMAAWRAEGADAWERLTPGDWRGAGRPQRLPIDVPARRPRAPEAPADKAAYVERILGEAQRVYRLPDGSRLSVTAKALAEHVPEDRLPYLELLQETLEQPAEIWLAFERHKGTGQVRLRKRLVKAVRTGKDRYIIVVGQASQGRFEAWTVIPTSKAAYAQRQRAGWLLWAREGE